MSKITDAQDIAETRDLMVRVFQGRSREEIERIKDFLQIAFPRPAPAMPDTARTKRKGQ